MNSRLHKLGVLFGLIFSPTFEHLKTQYIYRQSMLDCLESELKEDKDGR